MTRTRKIVMVSGAGLTALVILLLVGAMVVVRSGWFREKVRLRIVTEVERATGGRVEVGGFRFAWERLEAEVDSFVLHGKEPAGEPPLFRARTLAYSSAGIGLPSVRMIRHSGPAISRSAWCLLGMRRSRSASLLDSTI